MGNGTPSTNMVRGRHATKVDAARMKQFSP